jgi:hypothetical protein
VALPSIHRGLHARISDLQRVLNAYTLVVGVLLVTGGRFGDLLEAESSQVSTIEVL